MFSFFKKKPPVETPGAATPETPATAIAPAAAPNVAIEIAATAMPAAAGLAPAGFVAPAATAAAAHAAAAARGATEQAPMAETRVAKSVFSPSSWFGGKSAPAAGLAAPVIPVATIAPVAPIEPIAPFVPVAPIEPVAPGAPAARETALVRPDTPATTPFAAPAPILAPAPVSAPTLATPASTRAAISAPASADLLLSPIATAVAPVAVTQPPARVEATEAGRERQGWLAKLHTGLRKTGTGIQAVFVNAQIDDALYEELEAALLMADCGVRATDHLLEDLRRRVKNRMATQPAQVKGLLAEAIADLLLPLEKALVVGEHEPTVIMVAGVNGAGKTTSIGKLTRHLSSEGASVLLAAADTFRAAAREQLLVWADRNTVEIVSQEGGDPAAVSFDAVTAGRARGKDVVLIDTAGRLPTQLHLMDELKKIKRVITKADATAPHEVLLVIDGNTGQNALAQVKAFDETLGLTGLIVTKLDGTAKGGALCAIALWARDRSQDSLDHRPVPVYFIGVGEKLEDLETFNAREFAQALLG